MNETIEAASVDPPVSISPKGDVDPCFAATAQVVYCASLTLEALIEQKERGGDLPEVATQDYVDELTEAFQVGKRIVTHDRRDEIMYDMSKCDGDLLRELRATVAYVAPHFGVEMSVPIPEGDDR